MIKYSVTLLAMLLISATSAYGLDVRGLKADIPFAFNIGNATLPAGEYLIIPRYGYRYVFLRNAEGHGVAFGLTFLLQRAAIPEVIATWAPGLPPANSNLWQPEPSASSRSFDSSIVFNKYGDRYFICQVWSGLEGLGFPVTRSERALRASGMSPRVEILLAERDK